MTHPPGETPYELKPPMDRSSKAVIAQVLGDNVTPLLQRHGFDRRGRVMYDRVRDGRRELIIVEPHGCNRYGGQFTINLGIFIPEVDAAVSLYPLQALPQEEHCQGESRISRVASDGRMRADHREGPWWEFDAATDLRSLGAEVRQRLEYNALNFFDHLSTGAGMVEWLRNDPFASTRWPDRLALFAYAGERAQAEQWLQELATDDPASAEWYWRWRHREAARIAGRLGLACPAPADTPAWAAVFRVAADTTPQQRYDAFHRLDYKFGQYAGHLRTLLPAQVADRIYHTAECTFDTCTIAFYGAEPEELLHRLQRATDRPGEQFADITVYTGSVPADGLGPYR